MINLLPPKEKEILIQEENWKLVLIFGILILVFLSCLILVLLAIQINISGKIEAQKILVDLEEKKIKTLEIETLREKITSVNQNISKSNSFYQDQINLVEIFEKISEVLPKEMYLNSFSYQKGVSQISLSGFAPSGEILEDFKKNLESEEKFTEISFSTQSWFEPADFHVNFKIIQ